MIKRLFCLGMAVTAAAVLATWSAPRAHAQTLPPSDVIAFTGTGTISSDGTTQPCGDPVDANLTETPHLDSLGGCGTFSFTSIACAGTSDPEVTPLIIETGFCTLTFTLSFNNTMCGSGAGNTSGGAFFSGFESGTTQFGITFVAGVGLLTGGPFADGTAPPGDPLEPNDSTVTGVVQIYPSGTGALPDGPPDCTNGFSVTGMATAGE
jgi:hypothetical protein